MPAKSKAQQMMMGAELRRRKKGMKSRMKGMSMSQLEEFASTKRKGLPKRARSSKGGARRVRSY